MIRIQWCLLFLFAALTALHACSRSAIPMDVDGDGIPDHRDSDIGGWTDEDEDDEDSDDPDSFWIDTQSDDSTSPFPGTDTPNDTSGFETDDPSDTSSGQGSDSGGDTAPTTDNPDDTDSDTDTDTDSTIPYPPAAVHMWKCIICR